jgi:hypothetical protein
MSHFWTGSFCRCYSVIAAEHKDNPELYYPSAVVGTSDIIRICKDLGNNIPDKSWMLYLLELFDSDADDNNPRAIELNLICQFNGYDNFWAIFAGVNRYKFTKVLPAVGHSYLREIILHKYDKSIEYHIIDLNASNSRNTIEHFLFQLNEAESKNMSFQGLNQFTGIEWWNKKENSPFPIRYEVEFSDLRYVQELIKVSQEFGKEKNIEHVIFKPYNALVPNKDGFAKEYPVNFDCANIKDGCICYTVKNGSCSRGLHFLHAS